MSKEVEKFTHPHIPTFTIVDDVTAEDQENIDRAFAQAAQTVREVEERRQIPGYPFGPQSPIPNPKPRPKMTKESVGMQLRVKVKHFKSIHAKLDALIKEEEPQNELIQVDFALLQKVKEEVGEKRNLLLNLLLDANLEDDYEREIKDQEDNDREFLLMEKRVTPFLPISFMDTPTSVKAEEQREDNVMANKVQFLRESSIAEITTQLDTLSAITKAKNIDRIQGQIDAVQVLWGQFEKLDTDFLHFCMKVGTATQIHNESMKGLQLQQRKKTLERQAEELLKEVKDQQDARRPDPIAEHHALQHRRHLPKLKDSCKDWLPFWAHFEEINDNPRLSDVRKLQELIQSTVEGSEARETISFYSVAGENYVPALTALRNMYGRPNLLIKFHVRELLQLAVDKSMGKKIEFRKLVMNLTSCIRNLEMLGMTADNGTIVLYPIVEACLPERVLEKWQEHSNDSTDLKALTEFLQDEVIRKTERSSAQFQLGKEKQSTEKGKKSSSAGSSSSPTATSFHNNDNKPNCIFCDRKHPSKDCRTAWGMTLSEREDLVKTKRGCFVCLEVGHRRGDCPSRASIKCEGCGSAHHIVVCNKESQVQVKKEIKTERGGGGKKSTGNPGTSSSHVVKQEPEDIPSPPPSPTAGFKASVGPNRASTPLQIIPIKVTGVTGKTRIVRAMLDTGSQLSFIREGLHQELQFAKVGGEPLAHQLFGGVKTPAEHHDIVKLHAAGVDGSAPCHFDVYCIRTISNEVSSPPPGPWIEEFAKRGVTFHSSSSSTTIDVLIGNDVLPRLYQGAPVDLGYGPVAMNTRFGYVMCGKLPLAKTTRTSSMLITTTMSSLPISTLWDLDTIGIRDQHEHQTKEELAVATQQHFDQTVRRKDDGRYQVCLPFTSGSQSLLPSNYYGALKRLESTTAKLKKDGYLGHYSQLFQQWEADNMIEEVSLEDAPNIGHYLPHQAVIKLTSATTPVRPVFDASAKARGKSSLNDCLEAGPNYLELIPALLTRFRLDRIGVTADIKKAFQQVEVVPEHRDFLRFLWWADPNHKQVKVYRHTRVVFGVTSSPFLLAATLQHHLEKCPDVYKRIALRLVISLYVDNVVTSLSTLPQAQLFEKLCREVLEPALFDLRGWEYGPVSGGGKSVSVLGMVWDTGADTLSLELQPALEQIGRGTTPRAVLSLAHTLYDPLGIISPFIIIVKMILRRVHDHKLGWDQSLPLELQKDFEKWSVQIPILKDVVVNRFCHFTTNKSRSLHVFSDASSEAYAAAVYLRIEAAEGVKITLLHAKARVSPRALKKVSIPRLELIGCLIGVRLSKTVKKDMQDEEIPTTFWTDSTTALSWITSVGPWTVFVNNRVDEINKLTVNSQWNHVPGKLNPADLPSRGCSASKLIDSQWWEGPKWLYLPQSEWPQSAWSPKEEEVLQEKRKTVVTNVATNDNSVMDEFLKLSGYSRILHAVARWNRVKTNLLHRVERKKKLDLTAINTSASIKEKELQEAEILIIRHIQRELQPDTHRIQKLRPFRDENGLLRTRTRLLENEEINVCPIILQDENEFVRRMIRHLHCESSHIGTQLLLSKVRENYWLLNGRRTARKIVKSCWTCRRYISKRLHIDEAPLPITRTGTGAPFHVTGVDMTGPLILRNKKKVWIALFTCASYRAIHLEVVDSMTTDEFLIAFRRFVARRGKPSIVYSDNGLNFVGANKVLRKVYKDKVKSFASERRIEWRFSVPAAPWQGGFYERLIGLTKSLLRKQLGQRSVHQKELVVLLLDVEEALNNRPLTYLAEDPDDPLPLTPNMLVRNSGLAYFPEMDIRDATSARAAHRRVQKLREGLISRFRKDYLGQLKHERKVRKMGAQLKPGDVVLIERDNEKRQFWPLAVVIEAIPGKDGLARMFRLKTKTGILERPAQRLFPMELAEEET